MTVIEQRTMESLIDLNSKIPEITLRDIFAMSVLTGMYANGTYFTDCTYRDFAVTAYEQAEEMIKVRKGE